MWVASYWWYLNGPWIVNVLIQFGDGIEWHFLFNCIVSYLHFAVGTYLGSCFGWWSTGVRWQHMWCSSKYPFQWRYIKCLEPQCIRSSGLFEQDLLFWSCYFRGCVNYFFCFIYQAVMALRDSIKRHLKLPHSYVMEYKPHDASLRDNSSYRNTWLRG